MNPDATYKSDATKKSVAMNPDDYLYEYAIVHYVPRVERREFINVGLVMMCKRRRWIHSAVHIDADRIKAFDPETDIAQLRDTLGLVTSHGVPAEDLPVEERYRWLTAKKSAIMQISPSHPGIVASPDPALTPQENLLREFDRLMRDLVL